MQGEIRRKKIVPGTEAGTFRDKEYDRIGFFTQLEKFVLRLQDFLLYI